VTHGILFVNVLNNDFVRDQTYWKKLILLKWESLTLLIDLLYYKQLQSALLFHKQVSCCKTALFMYRLY